MFLSFLRLAYRNVKRQRRRSFTVFLAIFFSVFLLVIQSSFITGWGKVQEQRLFEDDGHIQITAKGFREKADLFPIYLNIPYNDDLKAIEKMPHVSKLKPEIRFGGLASFQESSNTVQIYGVLPDKLRYPIMSDSMIEGRFLTHNKEVIMGKRLAILLGCKVGDSILVLSNDVYSSFRAVKVKVVGLFESHVKEVDEGQVYMSLGSAQRALRMPNRITQLLVHVDFPKYEEGVFNQVNSVRFDEDVDVTFWKDLHKEIIFFRQMSRVQSLIIGVIIIILAGTGMINSILMSLLERMREFGSLRALGMKRRELVLMVNCEVLIVAVIASVFALIFSGAITYYYSINGINMGAIAEQLEGFSKILYFDFSWLRLLRYLLLGCMIAVLGTIYPLFVALRVQVVKAIQYK